MEFKNTVEVLYAQADEIRKLAAKLADSDEIRVIELDLLLEKLRNIYDLILDLEAAIPAESKTMSKDKRIENQVTTQQKTQKIDPEIEEEERVEPGMKTEKSPETKAGDTELQEESSKQSKSKTDKGLISDRFKGSTHTLHEEMASRASQEDISTQYKSKPISNILGAIAINERFELINQLFNGNKAQFEHAMEVLNGAGSFVEAYNYLMENFNWDMDNEYVQKILELIRRKLIIRRND
jgi:hypothetical protein